MNNEVKNQVSDYISKRLSEFFVVTDDPYNGATDYKKSHQLLKPHSLNSNKMTIAIHRTITSEVAQRFKLYPKKIGDSRLEIDLWNEADRTAYEIVLGNGDEIWKDVLKAILVGASKLVVFSRNYPDIVRGYKEIVTCISNMQEYLEGKLEVQVILIQVA